MSKTSINKNIPEVKIQEIIHLCLAMRRSFTGSKSWPIVITLTYIEHKLQTSLWLAFFNHKESWSWHTTAFI